MKIHIIGGPGTGKSWLARRLAERYGAPHIDLDDLFWENEAGYGVKRPAPERDRLLQQALGREQWITEGVYYAWVSPCFAQADAVYVLDRPLWLCRLRMVRRFVRRRLGREPGKRESLRSLRELLRWAGRYKRKNLTQIRNCLAGYGGKVQWLRRGSDIRHLLKTDDQQEEWKHEDQYGQTV